MWALKKHNDVAACANGTNRLYGSPIEHRRKNAITSKHEASNQKAAARNSGSDWRNVCTDAVVKAEGMRIRDVEWQRDKGD